MKYLCLCHYEPARHAACTPEDFVRIKALCATQDAKLYADPRFVAVGSFADPADYAVIRSGPDGPVMESGPYAQTTEPYGAFFLVEAGSMEEAIEVASKHPSAFLGREFGGGIEVRPCRYFRDAAAAAD